MLKLLFTFLGKNGRVQLSKTRKYFRPILEVLGERIVPATIVWDGSADSNWNNGNNWAGGAAPGPFDLASLTDQGNAPKILANDTAVAGNITTLASFANRTLEIEDGARLLLQNGGSGWDHGTLQIASTGSLDLHKATTNDTNFTWEDGAFQGGGTIYISNGYIFRAWEDARDLGVNVVIGENALGNPGTAPGEFYISTLAAQGQLTGNLQLNDAVITVETNGVLHFTNGVDSDTRGGIQGAGNLTGYIENYGKIVRWGDDNGKSVNVIDVPLVMSDESIFEIHGGMIPGAITWNTPQVAGPSIAAFGGTIEIRDGAKLETDSGIDLHNGGEILVENALLTENRTSATIVGDVNVYGGNINIGYQGYLGIFGFSTLTIDGDLFWADGTLFMDVQEYDDNGNNIPDQDLLSITGTFELDENNTVTLNVITRNQPADVDDFFEIIEFGQQQGAADFAFFDFNGEEYDHGIVNGKYRITAAEEMGMGEEEGPPIP